ncbi:hypothetical protein HKBW3S09_00634 [Candidatus Hakubella thermalkaliphila]|uniref:Uncharacterized protein n=1 Tax=Candidatus Hakubella thermalkaliphila TaxID=2754717 RepID=A0A6V8NSV3_9ACTN|nr:hypothetical protein HKBW3S09_00634 [Candidatus Hakubella thermalkaliphila]
MCMKRSSDNTSFAREKLFQGVVILIKRLKVISLIEEM